jgi:hypothetical protein
LRNIGREHYRDYTNQKSRTERVLVDHESKGPPSGIEVLRDLSQRLHCTAVDPKEAKRALVRDMGRPIDRRPFIKRALMRARRSVLWRSLNAFSKTSVDGEVFEKASRRDLYLPTKPS